jgi:hypothetical protein
MGSILYKRLFSVLFPTYIFNSNNSPQHVFFCELNSTNFNYFELLITTAYLDFFSTLGFWDNPQWIFQKHWTCLYWVALKLNHKVLNKNPSMRGFFRSSFQNCFWNLFNTPGLSGICKIRNEWKFPSSFPRNALIASNEKTSWSPN